MSTKTLTDFKNFFSTPEDRFINRELSWLEFNTRVLEEAGNIHHPLLERVKFLSISASNLDEFFMVRVAGLKDQITHNVDKKSIDGLTPMQQLIKIREKAYHLMDMQQQCWSSLKHELSKEKIDIITLEQIDDNDKKWLKNYFLKNIFPALSPIAIDHAHPFPFLPNLGIAMVFELRKHSNNVKSRAILPIPGKLPRFIRLDGQKQRFILLDDVIDMFKEHLFTGNDIIDFGVIRILRDSDLDLEEEAEDLVRNFENAVQRRRRGNVIQLKMTRKIPDNLREFVTTELKVDKDDVVERNKMLGLAGIIELYDQSTRSDLKFSAYEPRFPERINDYNGDCFAAIAAKDIVIHHPYETFNVVISFLKQAAKDPDVIAIKQTLYRTSNDSPIVKALIEAAEAGKSVTVVVELKARFDEEANIKWARNLERAGAQVIFGFVHLKTHCKVSMVVRREHDGLKSYVHFGTGNYHAVTAKIYSDLSFFTCNETLCEDAAYLFNYLTGYTEPEKFNKLIISPLNLRKKLIDCINNEIEHAKSGRPANIWAKLNALVDPEVIDKLYSASQAGVKIRLVVRGICGLRPGIEGISDNIEVKSVVGRFLEHTRIICFGDGNKLPSPDAMIFISSADWMPRNLDHRVEVMVPIENHTVHEQIMSQIMVANLRDEKQSWYLQPDGSYKRKHFTKESFSAHEYFMTNPSLSGRGKALSAAESNKQRKKIMQLFSFDDEGK